MTPEERARFTAVHQMAADYETALHLVLLYLEGPALTQGDQQALKERVAAVLEPYELD